MAAGLPVIANNIPTMKELIKNRKNGFLVNYDNYEGVTKIIRKLLLNKNLRLSIGKRARQSARKYDWPNIVQMLDKIYKRLLA